MTLREVYITETRSLLAETGELVRQLYHRGRDGSLAERIIMLLRTIARSSHFMDFPAMESLAGAVADFFVSISQQDGEFNLLRSRLVNSCLEALHGALDSIALEGSCLLEQLDDLKQALHTASVQEVFAQEVPPQDSPAVMKRVRAMEQEQGSSGVLVPVERIQGILRTYDMLFARQVQLRSRLDDLENSLLLDSGSPQLMMPGIKETLSLLEGHMKALQEQLVVLGQHPLQGVLDQLRDFGLKLIRQSGKQVNLEIPSTTIRMDGEILSLLPEILMDVVENSVLYGIEEPGQRVLRGKEPQGRIRVSVRQQASRVVICIQDDGVGIDFNVLRERAVQLGLARQDEVDAMSQQELTRFLFLPEFSAGGDGILSAGATQGGKGLVRVWQGVDKLKGSVSLSGNPGEGISMEISLPDSLVVQEGVFVQAGGQDFMVLSHYVEEIANVRLADIIQSNTSQFMSSGGELVPLYNPALLLGRRASQSAPSDFCTVMVVSHYGKRRGLLIDNVLYYKKVLTKSLPAVMAGLRWIQAVVLDQNHRLVPVLYLPFLLSRLQSVQDYVTRSFEVSNRLRQSRILVVEDAATTREIERMILESESFLVEVARDGIEALEKLRRGWFDLVVTDVAMPRMDGLVLIKNIRRLQGYENVPVVVVSSDVDRDMEVKVQEVGGQGCITKFHFQRGRLVSLVRELLNG